MTSVVRPRPLLAAALAAALLVTAFDAAQPRSANSASAESSAAGPWPDGTVRAVGATVPSLRTHPEMRNLDIPWDIAVLPGGGWLVTERDRQRILFRRPGGHVRVVSRGPAGLWSSDETGLMSVVVDPNVKKNNRFYTCTGWRNSAGHHDIRVLAWRINDGRRHARVVETLLKGISITTGRHGGCRLRFGRHDALWVGTGDSAAGTNPQNLRSLNGKLLRLNRFTGRPWPSNPWIHTANHNRRYIYTYGHRNIQGLALRPHGSMWSVEHGTDRDDEVNRAVRGGNYGWNPVPGYDESGPMTDFSLPGHQIPARWRSGFPTLATSGAVWVRGARWGAYRGTLAVCALKAERLLFLRFNRSGTFKRLRTPPAMLGTYGRLRSVVRAPNNDLLVTTSNSLPGARRVDEVVRVSPR